MNCFYYT